MSAAPLAFHRQGIPNPALPGWADVQRAALRASDLRLFATLVVWAELKARPM
jgi:hypothetical protein